MGLGARQRLRASERERSGEEHQELSERRVAVAGNGAESTWEERSSRYGDNVQRIAIAVAAVSKEKCCCVAILTMNFTMNPTIYSLEKLVISLIQ